MINSETENIIIRPETPKDYRETETVIREAFWDVYKPGCDEHLIIHKLREAPAFVKELDLVACDGNKIVGVIVCPMAKIKNEENQEFILLYYDGRRFALLPEEKNRLNAHKTGDRQSKIDGIQGHCHIRKSRILPTLWV